MIQGSASSKKSNRTCEGPQRVSESIQPSLLIPQEGSGYKEGLKRKCPDEGLVRTFPFLVLLLEDQANVFRDLRIVVGLEDTELLDPMKLEPHCS